jgi:acetyl-CoA carboxylase biotin carboxylase subunit
MFKKVLVANRGEIAVRVMRALREMEIASVAVFSEIDRGSLHVQMADEAVEIGPAPSRDSYLRIDRILDVAARVGAEAIHPGYGFLSENSSFASACASAGIRFIGPNPDAIAQMGSKTAARGIAIAAGVPVVPGTKAGIASISEAEKIAKEIGYPILLKAAAGGGGKGMRRVDAASDLASAFSSASSEAENAFGSGEVYIEKLVERPRHIEIQVLGDEYGHLIHLGERECSIQRRHQKVIEECPSPMMSLHPDLREKMGADAVKVARAVNYSNAGTMEFLVDLHGNYFFLEMNTRLQVEHPVTELVTGIDLVRWQIRIAAGERLALEQRDIRWSGSAVECRVYAEDPTNNYFPSPGLITSYREPSGPWVRVDSGVYPGWNVPLDYDPLLAKLSVWAADRPAAIDRMRRALSEFRVLGIATNLGLFTQIVRDSNFASGELDTGFLDRFTQSSPRAPEPLAIVAAALQQNTARPEAPPASRESLWRDLGRRELMR